MTTPTPAGYGGATLASLEHLARQAGAILRDGYEKEHEVSYKGVIDLVTEVDHASESFLIGEITRQFPDHSMLAEESGGLGQRGAHHWLVDPIDGTVNYAHGIPIFCVSIAYAFDGQVTLGVVYDPMRDEMFSAGRGSGATLNGRPLACSHTQELARSLLVTGFPYDAWNTEHDNFANFVRFSKQTMGVRRLGSAALDLCYVAAGRFDGFWELALHSWDVAAGGLIAEEAGARVTNVRDGPDYLTPPQSVVAANPAIHAEILRVLREK
jgi:myo-inositol-1(or 4)-monophosphatase